MTVTPPCSSAVVSAKPNRPSGAGLARVFPAICDESECFNHGCWIVKPARSWQVGKSRRVRGHVLAAWVASCLRLRWVEEVQAARGRAAATQAAGRRKRRRRRPLRRRPPRLLPVCAIWLALLLAPRLHLVGVAASRLEKMSTGGLVERQEVRAVARLRRDEAVGGAKSANNSPVGGAGVDLGPGAWGAATAAQRGGAWGHVSGLKASLCLGVINPTHKLRLLCTTLCCTLPCLPPARRRSNEHRCVQQAARWALHTTSE